MSQESPSEKRGAQPTGIVYADSSLNHDTGDGHPESPARYTAVMNALSAAVATNGSRFVWALQPTIFEKQSLTDEEKTRVVEIAKIDPGMYEIHRSYHDAFYDVARQQKLLDLSQIFRDEERTIYIDDCHYNDLGNELIARQLLSVVLGPEADAHFELEL